MKHQIAKKIFELQGQGLGFLVGGPGGAEVGGQIADKLYEYGRPGIKEFLESRRVQPTMAQQKIGTQAISKYGMLKAPQVKSIAPLMRVNPATKSPQFFQSREFQLEPPRIHPSIAIARYGRGSGNDFGFGNTYGPSGGNAAFATTGFGVSHPNMRLGRTVKRKKYDIVI